MLALLHAVGVWHLPFVERLDKFVYDLRLRATMPRTLDPRIVIVDIDDASLHRLGQWPWSRDKLARLVDELTLRQHVAALGFDVLFVEPDTSSGLQVLHQLAEGPLRDNAAFRDQLGRLGAHLDHDAVFARAIAGRPVALGYYFSRGASARSSGELPAPVLLPGAFPGGSEHATRWDSFGGNIAPLAREAAAAGFLNVL
ncbi:MAG: CHASE2 domain-containing protein, partial [Gammaproteobacteria bacterium]|nr:CHASE2 domain-containing protein [Gammaproteobacteria bacterium]